MKNLAAVFILQVVFFQILSAQGNQWTFIKGDSLRPDIPYYGIKGIPQASNRPGQRWQATGNTDPEGNLWMFGGDGIDKSRVWGILNDLWKYNVNTNEWTWIAGSNTAAPRGVYGVQGIAAATNQPGGRYGCMSWTDSVGNFWVFGGQGYDANGNYGRLNDLWKYDVVSNQWTWIKGNNTINITGIYGIKGISDATNNPGSRSNGVSWKDDEGNFWLFGGQGYALNSQFGGFNDLWKYNIHTDQWTWMKGDSSINRFGIYGVRGMEDSSSKPGARSVASGFKDKQGNLYLYAGYGRGREGVSMFDGYLGDIWKYNVATNNWIWIDGDSLRNITGTAADASWTDSSGVFWSLSGLSNRFGKYDVSLNQPFLVSGNKAPQYGIQGVPDKANYPSLRSHSVSWTDSANNFWLYGGSGRRNDLWRYNPATGEWTWMKGGKDFSGEHAPDYGTQGIASPYNEPGSMVDGVSFQDPHGNLWLFGGAVFYGNLFQNALWKYDTDIRQWTWVKGNNEENEVYGTKGLPAAANTPGGRISSSGWTDSAGNFWIFGGIRSYFDYYTYLFNDLWKFERTTNRWIWVSGDNLPNQPGNYGTKGLPAPSNKPGARHSAHSWKGASGTLWLFGGVMRTSNFYTPLNDLWKYDIATNTWTWMKGDAAVNRAGVYGTKGVADIANLPGSRRNGLTWTDSLGNLWLFGGTGIDKNGNQGLLNDLWKYDIVTGNWVWLHGDDIRNRPGSREKSFGWSTSDDKFYVFGGEGYTQNGIFGTLNDLWSYDISSNQWTFIKGDHTINNTSNYGLPDVPGETYKPGSRSSGFYWTDDKDDLWLYGGFGYEPAPSNRARLNDLWKFTIETDVVTCTPAGSITGEGFQNIPGTQVSDLTSAPSYPGSPSIVAGLTAFEYANVGINYGGRVRGFICAPQTGYYTFFIAGDDQAALYLSTDANPENKALIAYNQYAVSFRNWTATPTQKSAPIHLIANERYYIEALHKQGTGADHLSVGWVLPDGTGEGPIPASRLSPWEPGMMVEKSYNHNKAQETKSLKGLTIKATPNPSQNYFNLMISSDKEQTLTIRVMDIMGRVVENKNNVPATGLIRIGSKLNSGFYIVEVIQGAQKATLKLVKQ